MAAVLLSRAAMAQPSRWVDVPFIAQPENGCGAAAIAMTMQYWEKHGAVTADGQDVDHIQRQLYSETEKGIKASAMQRYFEDHGFRAFVLRGEFSDLEQHIAKGRPLIVALRPSKTSTVHYVVVAGTDAAQRLVMVNDPAQRKLLKLDLADFNKSWAATDYWTLLVIPKT